MRTARGEESEAIADLLCRSYVEAGLEAPEGPYLPDLRDVPTRMADPNARVLVAVAQAEPIGPTQPPRRRSEMVVGSVALCGHRSELATVCLPHEFEFRMLAVDPQWRNRGIAVALINACDLFGARLGVASSMACAWERNAAAIALYERGGFTRATERDWYYSPEEFLHVFVRPVAFCPQCGGPVADGGHDGCFRALSLEPPRFCAQCDRRMKVQIIPNGWSATCSRHGTVAS